MPSTPGIVFDVLSGPHQGHYEYQHEMFCDTWEGERLMAAADDPQWDNGFEIAVDDWPGPGEHVTELWMLWWSPQSWLMAYGGNNCYLDTVEGYPHVTGYFECMGMQSENGGGSVDVVNGTVVCN